METPGAQSGPGPSALVLGAVAALSVLSAPCSATAASCADFCDPSAGGAVCHGGVEYPTPSTIAGRFASLGWHTYSSSEPFHSPASGRLQMRCCLTSQKGDKGGGKAPMRYVKQSAIHAGANAGLGGAGAQDGSLMPRTPRTPSGARDERFGLLVDGEYYGPFAYCHVSPCVVPGSSEQISLPLATFFPIGDEDGDGIDDF